MVTYFNINDNFYKAKSINCDFDQLVIYHFCKSINNNKDRVIDIIFLICEY